VNEQSQDKHLFVVKNWHAVLVLIFWLIVTVTQFVTLQSQTAQNTKDIERLKNEMIGTGRFEETRQDILRRLDRIEAKIDERLAIKELK